MWFHDFTMKMKRLLVVFVLIFSIFIFVLIFSIGFFTDEEPQLSPSVTIIEEEIFEEDANLLSYDNIRFINTNITYEFDDGCSQTRIQEVNQAFNLLSEETVLNFRRVSVNPEIEVNCIDDGIKTSQEYHVVGTGGPVSLINTTRYYLISKGSINLYGNEFCETPNYALHEILHVLGFSHSLNPSSIMYEVLSCNQEISDEIIDEISILYKDPILSDLVIVETNFTKSGKYLDLNVVVLNAGLANAEDVSLTLYNKNRKLKELDLEDFTVGTAKVVFLDEIYAPKEINEFTLILDEEDLNKELDESNNVFMFEG